MVMGAGCAHDYGIAVRAKGHLNIQLAKAAPMDGFEIKLWMFLLIATNALRFRVEAPSQGLPPRDDYNSLSIQKNILSCHLDPIETWRQMAYRDSCTFVERTLHYHPHTVHPFQLIAVL